MEDLNGKKISILGTEYSIAIQTPEENPKLQNANGLCEFWSKRIIMEVAKPALDTFENLDDFNAKVMRHEIVHAFLGESGLKDYMGDEVLTDWIAVQFPKMLKVFRELGLIKED
jgi:hypothetical protein